MQASCWEQWFADQIQLLLLLRTSFLSAYSKVGRLSFDLCSQDWLLKSVSRSCPPSVCRERDVIFGDWTLLTSHLICYSEMWSFLRWEKNMLRIDHGFLYLNKLRGTSIWIVSWTMYPQGCRFLVVHTAGRGHLLAYYHD